MKKMGQIKTLFTQRLKDVGKLVKLTNKSSVLVIQQFPIESDTNTLFPNVRESISNILAFVELGRVDVLDCIIEMADGNVDCIVFDADDKCKGSKSLIKTALKKIKKSKLFFYSDNNTWADSAINFLQQLSGGIHNKLILLAGEGLLYDVIKRKLNDYNANLVEGNEKVDIIIGASVKRQSIGEKTLNIVEHDTKVYDVGIGNFSNNFIKGLKEKGADIYRIDIRAGISSLVLGILETDYLISNVLGSEIIKEVNIVAGGAMGDDGAVIVDDISSPAYVIGIADGKGNVKNLLSKKEEKNIAFIERLINPSK